MHYRSFSRKSTFPVLLSGSPPPQPSPEKKDPPVDSCRLPPYRFPDLGLIRSAKSTILHPRNARGNRAPMPGSMPGSVFCHGFERIFGRGSGAGCCDIGHRTGLCLSHDRCPRRGISGKRLRLKGMRTPPHPHFTTQPGTTSMQHSLHRMIHEVSKRTHEGRQHDNVERLPPEYAGSPFCSVGDLPRGRRGIPSILYPYATSRARAGSGTFLPDPRLDQERTAPPRIRR